MPTATIAPPRNPYLDALKDKEAFQNPYNLDELTTLDQLGRQKLGVKAIDLLRDWAATAAYDPKETLARKGWGEYAETIVKYQQAAAALATATTIITLESQGPIDDVEYLANPETIGQVTSDGYPAYYVAQRQLEAAATRQAEKQAAQQPWFDADRYREAYSLLVGIRGAVSNAAALSSLLQIDQKPGALYVRIANHPCCARCAILAGKKATKPTMGFARHPGCDCGMRAIHPDQADKFLEENPLQDPRKYFDSLSKEDQDRVFGVANSKAIRNGADIAQVINAQKGMYNLLADGTRQYVPRQGTFTRSGTVRYSGLAKRRLSTYIDKDGTEQTLPRLSIKTIYDRYANSPEQLQKALYNNGYLKRRADFKTGDLTQFMDEVELEDDIKKIVSQAETILQSTSRKAARRAAAAGGGDDGGTTGGGIPPTSGGNGHGGSAAAPPPFPHPNDPNWEENYHNWLKFHGLKWEKNSTRYSHPNHDNRLENPYDNPAVKEIMHDHLQAFSSLDDLQENIRMRHITDGEQRRGRPSGGHGPWKKPFWKRQRPDDTQTKTLFKSRGTSITQQRRWLEENLPGWIKQIVENPSSIEAYKHLTKNTTSVNFRGKVKAADGKNQVVEVVLQKNGDKVEVTTCYPVSGSCIKLVYDPISRQWLSN